MIRRRLALALYVVCVLNARISATPPSSQNPSNEAAKSITNPTMGVLISESFQGHAAPNGVAAANLIDELEKRGFRVFPLRIGDSAKFAGATHGDLQSASELGAKLGAEILVAGNCSTLDDDVSTIPVFQNTAIKRSRASVSIQAIDVRTRTVLASKTEEGVEVHPNTTFSRDLATRNAIRKLVQKGGILDKMMLAWQNRTRNSTMVSVQIRGIPDFKTSLAATTEIQAKALKVENRKLDQGVLTLDATWQGTFDDFCNYLDGHKFNQDQNTLSVVSAQKNSVLLEVK